MKLENQNVSANRAGAANLSITSAVSPGGRSGGAASAGGAGSDRIELSGVSRLLQTSSSQRAARVEALTASVQSGRYQVDAPALAKAIVGETIGHSAAQGHR